MVNHPWSIPQRLATIPYHLPAPGLPRQIGFTLIEVLVAFVIAALSITVVFQMIGGSANNLALTGDYHQAMLVAGSIVYDPADDAPMEGEVGRFHWQKTILPAGEVNDGDRSETVRTRDIELADVDVTVTWRRNGKDHQFKLGTQRIVSNADSYAR